MLVEYVNTVLSNAGYSDDDGYRVYRCRVLEPDDSCKQGDEIIITGYDLPASDNLRYLVAGKWKDHPKYGRQYNVMSFEDIIPRTCKGIVGYLSSGRIKGVTPALAERIYHEFRNETITILDEKPEALLEIPGIGEQKYKDIIKSYYEDRILKKLFVKYKRYGVSEKIIKKMFFQYGKETEKSIQENPYLLCNFGATIREVDRMATTLPSDHTGRAKAVILETIMQYENEGNTCMPFQQYYKSCLELSRRFRISREMLSRAESELCQSGELIYYEKAAERKMMSDIEDECAKQIFRITNSFELDSLKAEDTENEISMSERKLHCRLHIQQREAVKTALLNGITIISGGPGTGKTTIVQVIRDIIENRLHSDVVFLSPTGRAASRMKESSGYDAFTVHKKLKIYDDSSDNQEVVIPEKNTVCDEFSMVDIYLLRRLLQSIQSGSRLIILGDVEQLPSVGPGAVLRDLIQCKQIATVFLTKVFRQSSGSNIYLNCRKIVKGNLSLEYGDDFVLLSAFSQEEAADLVVDAFIREVDEFGLDDVCCICPFKGSMPTGVAALNKRIQAIINPPSVGKAEIHCGTDIFRVGDRVMNLKNLEDVSNGDIGYIVRIDGQTMTVKYGKINLSYNNEELKDSSVALAYCMTIHKSQGSEFKSVITPLLEDYARYNMLQMNLMNTAISRAKVRYTCVGNENALKIAICNRQGAQRYTMLCEKIKVLFDYKRGK